MELRERMKKLKQRQKGFTLVELIVVIAIIGILAGVMLPRYFGFADSAREGAAISEAKSIRTLLETDYANSDDGKWMVLSGDSVVPGKDPDTDTDDSTFPGKITTTAASDGSFTYVADNGWTATCTVDGVITAAKTETTSED